MTAEKPVLIRGIRYGALCYGFSVDLPFYYTITNGKDATNNVRYWNGVAYIFKPENFQITDYLEQIGFETSTYPIWENDKKNYTLIDALVDYHHLNTIPGNDSIESYRSFPRPHKETLPRIIDLSISNMIGEYRIRRDKLSLTPIIPLDIIDLVNRDLCAAGTIDKIGHKHLLIPNSVRIPRKNSS